MKTKVSVYILKKRSFWNTFTHTNTKKNKEGWKERAKKNQPIYINFSKIFYWNFYTTEREWLKKRERERRFYI